MNWQAFTISFMTALIVNLIVSQVVLHTVIMPMVTKGYQ